MGLGWPVVAAPRVSGNAACCGRRGRGGRRRAAALAWRRGSTGCVARARAVRRADLGQTRGREAVLARGRDAWGGQVAPAYGAAVGRARGGAGEETGDGNFVNKPNFKM